MCIQDAFLQEELLSSLLVHSKSITQIMTIKTPTKQDTFTISYQRQEAEKIVGMEYKLMEHFEFNRSQLHKNLVRDAYRKLSLLQLKTARNSQTTISRVGCE